MKVATRPLILALAVAALLASTASAQTVTVTQSPGPVLLHNAQGNKIGTYATMAECLAAAEAGPAPGAKSSCRAVTYLVKTGTCDASVPPELPTDQGEGLTVQCPADDTRYFIRALGWSRLPFSGTAESCTWKLETLPKEADPPICHTPVVTWSTLMPGETADDIAPTPPVDPSYDEHDPVGPTDDGPPGAPTVDKPAV